jgi:hypothetical protein
MCSRNMNEKLLVLLALCSILFIVVIQLMGNKLEHFDGTDASQNSVLSTYLNNLTAPAAATSATPDTSASPSLTSSITDSLTSNAQALSDSVNAVGTQVNTMQNNATAQLNSAYSGADGLLNTSFDNLATLASSGSTPTTADTAAAPVMPDTSTSNDNTTPQPSAVDAAKNAQALSASINALRLKWDTMKKDKTIQNVLKKHYFIISLFFVGIVGCIMFIIYHYMYKLMPEILGVLMVGFIVVLTIFMYASQYMNFS